VGFEPTVRLPGQRFSSSKILMACAVRCLTVCSSLAFRMRRSRLVVPHDMLCCVVRLQIRLQTSFTNPSSLTPPKRDSDNELITLAFCPGLFLRPVAKPGYADGAHQSSLTNYDSHKYADTPHQKKHGDARDGVALHQGAEFSKRPHCPDNGPPLRLMLARLCQRIAFGGCGGALSDPPHCRSRRSKEEAPVAMGPGLHCVRWHLRVTVVSAFHPSVKFERPPRTVRIDLDCPYDCSPKELPRLARARRRASVT
jgi:hypothetical protein